jgi:hypothetical protein
LAEAPLPVATEPVPVAVVPGPVAICATAGVATEAATSAAAETADIFKNRVIMAFFLFARTEAFKKQRRRRRGFRFTGSKKYHLQRQRKLAR